jgi:hypothetical protein
MAITFVPYIIVLDDATEVAALNAAPSRWNRPRNDIGGTLTVQSVDDGVSIQGGTGKLFCSPNRAVVEVPGCTIHYLGSGVATPAPPYLWSSYIWDDNSATYPLDQDTWTQENPDWVIGTGNRLDRYIWVGVYVYQPAVDATVTDDFQQLRFFEGFEHGDLTQNGGTGATATRSSREASRHVGQLGLYCCEATTGNAVTINTNALRGAGFEPTASWERLYLRIRTLPSAPAYFWLLNRYSRSSPRRGGASRSCIS